LLHQHAFAVFNYVDRKRVNKLIAEQGPVQPCRELVEAGGPRDAAFVPRQEPLRLGGPKRRADLNKPVAATFEERRKFGGERVQHIGSQSASARSALDNVELRGSAQQRVGLGAMPGKQLTERRRSLGAGEEISPGADVGATSVIPVLRVVERKFDEAGESDGAARLYFVSDQGGEYFSTQLRGHMPYDILIPTGSANLSLRRDQV
jgi:hypothetical protein